MPATLAGTLETIRARSRFVPFSEPLPVPRRLMSQKTPEARKPRGAMTDPVIRENFVFMNVQPFIGSGVNQQWAEDAMSVARGCREGALDGRGQIFFREYRLPMRRKTGTLPRSVS